MGISIRFKKREIIFGINLWTLTSYQLPKSRLRIKWTVKFLSFFCCCYSEPIRHFSTRKPGEKPGKSGRKSKAALSKGLVSGACFHFWVQQNQNRRFFGRSGFFDKCRIGSLLGIFQIVEFWWKLKDPSQKTSKPCSASNLNPRFIARDIRLVERRLLVAEEQVFIEFWTLKFSRLKNSALRHRDFLLEELVDF